MQRLVACPAAGSEYTSLTLAPSIDGFEVLTSSYASGAPTVTSVATLGQLCRTAKDAAKCRASVNVSKQAPASGRGWYPEGRGQVPGPVHYAVATRGDEVFVVEDQAALAKAVAPIESPEEAVALARLTSGPNVVCNRPNVTVKGTSYVVKSVSASACGGVSEALLTITQAGELSTSSRMLKESESGCAEGRRPVGLEESGAAWLMSLRAHFEEIAYMEAAAVLAFDDLIAQLTHLHAPADLLARVRVARRDEVRHARVARRLVTRFGGVYRAPTRSRRACHEVSRFELARENATEGCVREAMGALVAAHQAAHAKDALVRRSFARIAEEELAHAELSWDLDAWLLAGLSAPQRTEVERARQDALAALLATSNQEPCEEVRRVAGMPTAAVAVSMARALAGEVLRAAA